MKIFMRLWEWICSLFSTKTIETAKTKKLSTLTYKLTNEDWEFVEEQKYFKNLAKGKSCRDSRNRLVFNDTRLRYFKQDSEFNDKRTGILEDPKTLENKRRRRPRYIQSNTKIVKSLVEYKENKFSNVKEAFKANGVSYSTLTHQRNEKERDELQAKADLIVQNKLKKEKQKQDALKTNIKTQFENDFEPKSEIKLETNKKKTTYYLKKHQLISKNLPWVQKYRNLPKKYTILQTLKLT